MRRKRRHLISGQGHLEARRNDGKRRKNQKKEEDERADELTRENRTSFSFPGSLPPSPSFLFARSSYRYLRAQKWDTETTISRIIATLLWRRETGIADDDGGEGPREEGGGLLPGPLAEKSSDGDE